MPQDDIQVPPGLTTDGLLAKRYMARFVDSLVILALLVAPALWLEGIAAPHLGRPLTLALFLPLIGILWIGYGSLLESSPWQATLGKRLTGLRVYDSDGQALSLFPAIVRNVVKDGPFLVCALLPGGQLVTVLVAVAHIVVMHRSPVNQAIHDRVAHSWVAAPENTVQLRIA